MSDNAHVRLLCLRANGLKESFENLLVEDMARDNCILNKDHRTVMHIICRELFINLTKISCYTVNNVNIVMKMRKKELNFPVIAI